MRIRYQRPQIPGYRRADGRPVWFTRLPALPHTCPYREEIHQDYTSMCDCSDSGTYECVLSI